MKLALIDGDLVTYPCAASAENDSQEIAESRCDHLLRSILHTTNSIDYRVYLTGSGNFRYDIYPSYKGNREGKPRPIWLQHCREHLLKYWKATVTDGNEADDELAIEQTAQGLESVICSFDKDLLQVPGHHYNWKTDVSRFISPFDGLRIFYGQLIAGDGADNIPSYDGKIRSSVPKFIQKLQEPLWDMTEELDMYNYVSNVWVEQGAPEDTSGSHRIDIMNTYARCLWVQRREGEIWQPPNGQTQE